MSPGFLTKMDRGISLIARIAGQRAGSFDHGLVGVPLARYTILLEREARVRRIIREQLEREMIAVEALATLRGMR